METQQFKCVPLSEKHLYWFVNEAAVRMLVDELKRPDYVNMAQLYRLAFRGMNEETAWVVLSGDKPVGALGSLLFSNPFNPDLSCLSEIFWYVLPEYRNGRAGALLLKSFEEKAKDCAYEATLSLLTTSDVTSLERRGWMNSEKGFRKVMNGGN